MDDKQPLYLQLASSLEHQARNGSLRAGTRLPSVRTHAQQQGVSISTVLQAYRALEDRGVIEARPKSGFFVRRAARSPAEPLPSRPSSRPAAVGKPAIARVVMEAAGDPTYHSFGAAQASPDLYPNERMRRFITRAAVRHAPSLGRYPRPAGAEPLRQAIARHALSLGCNLHWRDVLVTHGCREAVALCLRAVTRPGDVVAIESPAYFGFLELLQSLQLRALEIPTHPRHGISLDALEFALDTQPVRALLVVPTVSNPLGSIMPVAAKRRLAALAAARDLPVIEDVICNELAASADARRAVRSFDPTGRVMLCGSFSKTLAPGLALGWVDAGPRAAELLACKTANSAGSPELLEWGLADMLDAGGYEPALRRLRSYFARQVQFARGVIGESFPAGTRVTNPDAGFFLWLELPAPVCALSLYEACLARQVVIAPGPLFGASARYAHCLRLSVGEHFTPARIQALRDIGALACEQLRRAAGKP